MTTILVTPNWISRRQPPTSSLVTINIQFFIGNITGSTIGRKTPIPALRNEHTDGNRDRNLLASGRDFSNINRQSYFKERNQTLPPLGFFLAKKNPGHFSPCSDKIFSWDFFKTNSTHRDLLIPRVFE